MRLIQSAATDGRGGLGTILVNSVHNSGPGFGGMDGNSPAFDANRFYIHVGGVLDTGDVAFYTTRGANMLVSAFTGAVGVNAGSPRNIEPRILPDRRGAQQAIMSTPAGRRLPHRKSLAPLH